MANLNLADGQLAATATALTTGPTTGQQAVHVVLHNTSASLTETVLLTVKRQGGTARRVARGVLGPNESLVVQNLALDLGDTLQGQTTDASTVDYVVAASNGGPLSMATADANGAVKASGSISGNQTVTGALTVTGATTFGAQVDTLTAITADGAVAAHTPASYIITKAGVAALTLAAPTATTDDGVILKILSSTANAHTLTATGLLGTGTASTDVATFAARAGAGLVLEAYQAKWLVRSSVGITFS